MSKTENNNPITKNKSKQAHLSKDINSQPKLNEPSDHYHWNSLSNAVPRLLLIREDSGWFESSVTLTILIKILTLVLKKNASFNKKNWKKVQKSIF